MDWLDSGEYSISITWGPSEYASLSDTCKAFAALLIVAAFVV
jgi:hypothetical protein